MREIKFRARNTTRPAAGMSPSATLQQLLKLQGRLGNHPTDETMIWMQYTGLKDAKGVEIYEGDIVKKYKGLRDIGSVVWCPEWTAFAVKDRLYGHILMTADLRWKVIGNIYENPELLK